MFSDSDFRKAVLDEKIHEELLDYMSFRHVFRHSYGHALDWERLNPLFSGVYDNWNKVKSNLLRFIEQ